MSKIGEKKKKKETKRWELGGSPSTAFDDNGRRMERHVPSAQDVQALHRFAALGVCLASVFFVPGVFLAHNCNLFKEAMARGSSGNCSNSSSSSSSSRNREEIGEQRSIMACLADDTLLEVLRHLPTRYLLHAVALVCRRWRRLCESRLVWCFFFPLNPSPHEPTLHDVVVLLLDLELC